MLRHRILLIGCNGQVGWELRSRLTCLGDVMAIDYPELELAASDSIVNAVEAAMPTVIVNAAAYTAVDRAETEPDLAMAINGVAPGILAEEARRRGCLLVHYSTDYVFDGTKDSPYGEADEPNPLNAYGKTKLAGDRAIEATGCDYLIFRTSWVYGARGNNFLLTMRRLAQQRRQLRIVDDQIGSPTSSSCIAECTASVLSQVLTPSVDGLRGRGGLYNLTTRGETSWFGFAKEIFRQGAAAGKTNTPALIPISSSEFPLPARRPANSQLLGTKLTTAFGISPPRWDDALAIVMESVPVLDPGMAANSGHDNL